MIRPYLLLFISVICEIIATSALKKSEGFTKLWPSVTVIVGYGLAFGLMSIILKTLPVSIVYAIWSGLGIVGIAIIGVFFFGESFGIWHFIGTSLIIAGVVMLNFITTAH